MIVLPVPRRLRLPDRPRPQDAGARASQAQAQDAASRQYIQSVAGSGGGAADEIARLADLKDQGVITDAEFQAGKAKALGS